MEYKPYQFHQGGGVAGVNLRTEELIVGSSVWNEPLTSTTIPLAVDFVTRRADRNFNKYVGVAKSKRKSGGSLEDASTSSTSRWQSVTSANNYHSGATKFIAQNVGLPVDTACGIMYVTYYVWFKTQRMDT